MLGRYGLSGALCLLFGLFTPPGQAHASSFNRNEAHLEWKTVETEHFRFHYAKSLEPVAEYIAGIAESVAREKQARYNIRLPSKVEFIIREDVFSNGWANSLQNIMTVWVADWDFPIRSTHNWLKDVITHEYAHLVSIQSGSKLPSWLQGLVIGYQDYYNEPVQASFATIFPFTHQPNWFAEGMAQYESGLSGFDAWDSHRDMLLRIAVLEDRLLSYPRMGSFAGNSLEYEQGPYTQGFAFVNYLARRFGDDAMVKLWSENARIHRQTLSGTLLRVVGKKGEELWRDWSGEMTSHYTEQVKALGHQVYGRKLTSESFYNYYPRWNTQGDSLYFVSNQDRDNFRATLYRMSPSDTAKPKEERMKAVSGAVRGYFDIARDDSTFLFSSTRDKNPHAIPTLDIYSQNLKREKPLWEFGKDKTQKRFTEDLNAAHASYSPDGKTIVFVRHELSNFFLCTAPVPEGDKLDTDAIKTLFPSPEFLDGRFGFNVYTPRFSPDGKRILFSYFDGYSRNVGIIDADGGNFEPLLSMPHDERDPEWHPDGNSFFYSSDSTGIYNIYRYVFARNQVQAITNVAGGAFSPAIKPDGSQLAYVNYDKDGFSLYLLPHMSALINPSAGGEPAIRHRDTTRIAPLDFGDKSQPYAALPNRFIVSPILYGQEMAATTRLARKGETKVLAGVSALVNDPLNKNELNGALLFEIGNGFDYFGAHSELLNPDKESQLFLSLRNHSLPVSLGAAFFRANVVTHDTITIKDVNLAGGSRVERQNYALSLRNAEVNASYELFNAQAVSDYEKSNFVHLAGGYSWNEFNFYDFPFSFTYYRNLYVTGGLNLYSPSYSDKGRVAPKGMAAGGSYTFNRSELVRQGSFRETFVIEDGILKTRFREYDLQEANLAFTYGVSLPGSKHSSLLLTAHTGSIIDWTYNNPMGAPDTLDSFFSKGLFLRGYPYLRDVENLAFQGENVAQLSLDLNQPLISDIYKKYWVLFVEDLYGHLFWEAGRAWNGKLYDSQLFSAAYWDDSRRADAWRQSVGWGLKLNARIYHNYPFLIYFEAATALNRLSGPEGLEKVENIEIALPRGASLDTRATRISFGFSFGLYNGLLGSHAPREKGIPLSHGSSRP